MANGELCKHCGHQETEHESGYEYDFGNPSKRVAGYRKSLLACGGFVSGEPEREMSDREFRNYSDAMENRPNVDLLGVFILQLYDSKILMKKLLVLMTESILLEVTTKKRKPRRRRLST
jgi:hypothetical protein